VGAQGPMPETCDGVDNNCDGKIDNPTITTGSDDVPHGLCRSDHVCLNGQCVVPPNMAPPQTQEFPNGSPAGCVCGVGHGGPSGALSSLALAALVGLAIQRRRIRRRK
jgi:hypothetical protein